MKFNNLGLTKLEVIGLVFQFVLRHVGRSIGGFVRLYLSLVKHCFFDYPFVSKFSFVKLFLIVKDEHCGATSKIFFYSCFIPLAVVISTLHAAIVVDNACGTRIETRFECCVAVVCSPISVKAHSMFLHVKAQKLAISAEFRNFDGSAAINWIEPLKIFICTDMDGVICCFLFGIVYCAGSDGPLDVFWVIFRPSYPMLQRESDHEL